MALNTSHGSIPVTAITQEELQRMQRALAALKALGAVPVSCLPSVERAGAAARVFGPVLEWFTSGDEGVYNPMYPYVLLTGGWIDIVCRDYGLDQYSEACEELTNRMRDAIEAASSIQADDPDLAPLLDREFVAVVPRGYVEALRAIEGAVQCRTPRRGKAAAVAILATSAAVAGIAGWFSSR